MSKYKTRFAPSPSGKLHLGGARIALLSYLLSKYIQGDYILRIDDTNTLTTTTDSITSIHTALDWMGILPSIQFQQSKRTKIYDQYLNILFEKDLVYLCHCPKDTHTEQCRLDNSKDYLRAHAVRIKSHKTLVWRDLLLGPIPLNESDINDYIIRRQNGQYTYNYTSVVDDIDMGITHIIRGVDHLINTGHQVTLFNAFNYQLPKFYHVGLVLTEEGKKLSKRHNASGITDLQDMGIIPASLNNFLFKMSHSTKNQEIISLQEMEDIFTPEKMNKAYVKFSLDKLQWINKKQMQLHHKKIAEDLQVPPELILRYARKYSSLHDIRTNSLFLRKRADHTGKQYNHTILKQFLDILTNNKIEDLWDILSDKYQENTKDIKDCITQVLAGQTLPFTLQQIITWIGLEESKKRIQLAITDSKNNE